MALGDRDYMRRPMRPYVGRGLSSWTVRLIVFCVAVMFVQRAAFGWFGTPIEPWFTVSWPALRAGRVWTVLSSAFLHADFYHLLWNMVGLYFFGRMTEEAVGSRPFVVFCAVAALFGSAGFLLDDLWRGAQTSALGASGFVTATLAFAALRFPRTPFRLMLFPFFPVPLWVLAIVWVGGDLFGVATGEEGVAYAAHLGGAFYGFLTYRFGVLPRFGRFGAASSSPGAAGPSTGTASDQAALRGRVDGLLEKINQHGIGSLTDEERRFLDDASRRYR